MNKLFGLIGYPLSHSFSKKYFLDKFEKEGIEAQFLNFEIPSIDEFPNILIKHANIQGFSITIPYKEKIIPFLSEIDEEAKQIGAVNAVKVILKNGNKIARGYNTDIYGFKLSLQKFLGNEKIEYALILGTGGASKAIAEGLKRLDIKYNFVSRYPQKATYDYTILNNQIILKHKLIINTTPLGTYPEINTSPAIPYEYLTSNHFLFDLVYNPSETEFLKHAKLKGANAKNGLEMLHIQAERAWQIWNE